MYFLVNEKIINSVLKLAVNKIVKFLRKKLKRNDYNENEEKIKNELNKMSKEKITRWNNERRTGKK